MTQIFGDFIEERHAFEYLKLGFSAADSSLKHRWNTNGLSADFIADYLQTFFVGVSEKNNGHTNDAPIPAQSKYAVKYVANELLENAMKFSDEQSTYLTKISFNLYNNNLVFHVSNSIKSDVVEEFQTFLEQLLNSDPYDLYFRQMKTSAKGDDHRSRLGLLSMICDYEAKLGWKFETIQDAPLSIVVTTMVCLSASST